MQGIFWFISICFLTNNNITAVGNIICESLLVTEFCKVPPVFYKAILKRKLPECISGHVTFCWTVQKYSAIVHKCSTHFRNIQPRFRTVQTQFCQDSEMFRYNSARIQRCSDIIQECSAQELDMFWQNLVNKGVWWSSWSFDLDYYQYFIFPHAI